jgi:hypothetical protein
MAASWAMLKLYQFFTKTEQTVEAGTLSGRSRGCLMVAGIALAMFIALFGWGASYFGWHDPSGKVQLALFTSFILGVIASYKSRG